MDFSRLAMIREKKELSQREVAKILHVSKSTYARWETGEQVIPLNHLNDFCKYFKVTVDYVLNLSNHVLAVGISQRTEAGAIDELAKNMFKNPNCEIDTILAFNIPESRAFMHLDTVFTQIDYDKFTYHPGIMDTLQVYEITEGDNPDSDEDLNVKEVLGSLEEILEHYLGREVTLIPCAGGERVASEREQWNDGTNTLCIAPGVVVVYDRNNITNNILRENGLTVLEMSSAELSRGRGGPRCMSMPLEREDI